MRAQVQSVDGKLRSALGWVKGRLGLSRKTRVQRRSGMHTGRTPGAKTPTDNDLEKVKLWSSTIKL